MAEVQPQDTLAAIQAALPAAEAALSALLAKPWAETVDKLAPLDRAKMDTLLAYAINDLIWVYMKMKGVDPADQEVSKQLERVRTYYAKVKEAEAPPTRRMTVNTAAAGRLVRGSIPASQRSAPPPQPETSAAVRARVERERAVAEQVDRVGMSNRFRFVGAGGEKVGVGAEAESQTGQSGSEEGDSREAGGS